MLVDALLAASQAAGVTNVLRATRDNVVAVDMGGFYYKQQFYTYDGIKSAATVYNMMEIDVATIDEWDLFVSARMFDTPHASKIHRLCGRLSYFALYT